MNRIDRLFAITLLLQARRRMRAQMLGAHAVGRPAADAERSLDKLAIALPKPLRAEMERLSEIIRFIAPGLHFDLDEPQVSQFLKSLGLKRRKVGMIPAKADPEKQASFRQKELEPVLEAAQQGKKSLLC